MRPWRVALGLTMTIAALGLWALWVELWYLRPFWPVLLTDYGWYIAARSLSLGAVGRKVDVVERAIRRGTGQDPELADALARDAAGNYENSS